MGICKDVEKLGEVIKPRCKEMLEKLEGTGIRYTIVETLRTYEVAHAYYLQGRRSLAEVNEARKVAGLYQLSDVENQNKVTELDPDIKKSKHMSGEAFDLTPLKENGSIDWNAPRETWLRLGEIGESCGLSWGGRWGQTAEKLGWDCPHFEV